MDEKTKTVYCPYCGKQMELKSIFGKFYYYRCPCHKPEEKLDRDEECVAAAPLSKTPEGAYKKATALYKPMRKPMECLSVYLHIGWGLTETEISPKRLLKYINARPLYLEINPKYAHSRELGRFDKHYCYPWFGPEDIRAMLRREEKNPEKYSYGRTYRFWWEEPSDEESAAAAWEE